MRKREDANSSENRSISVFLRFSGLHNEAPHIHVRRENKAVKFWLDPVALQKTGRFSRTELTRIARLVSEHREYLLERWHEFFGN